MAVVNGCPAFESGCPFPEVLQAINTQGCPAFKVWKGVHSVIEIRQGMSDRRQDRCPFDAVQQTKDIQSILETMPASHSSAENVSGKAVQTFFSLLHKFSAELSSELCVTLVVAVGV